MRYSVANRRWEVVMTATGMVNVYQNGDYVDPYDPRADWTNNTGYAVAAKKYYTLVDDVYSKATVTDGEAILPGLYYESNPEQDYVKFGYNSWRNSDLRQWLNSAAAISAWWSAQNIWDVAPAGANSMPGFLAGFTETDFMAAIGPVNLVTAKNTVTEGGGGNTTGDKVFLPSQTEVFGNVNNGIGEGVLLSLYNGAAVAARVKYNNANTAQAWYLRSPDVGSPSYGFRVTATGGLNTNISSAVSGVAPAYVVC